MSINRPYTVLSGGTDTCSTGTYPVLVDNCACDDECDSSGSAEQVPTRTIVIREVVANAPSSDRLRIRVGVTLRPSTDQFWLDVNEKVLVIPVTGLLPGRTWLTLDGVELPLTGEIDSEDVVSYSIDDETVTDEMTITFDTQSDEGLSLNQRIIVHYAYRT